MRGFAHELLYNIQITNECKTCLLINDGKYHLQQVFYKSEQSKRNACHVMPNIVIVISIIFIVWFAADLVGIIFSMIRNLLRNI